MASATPLNYHSNWTTSWGPVTRFTKALDRITDELVTDGTWKLK